MKKVDIVYFGDVTDVNGVNLVTNSFVKGKCIFEKKGLILNKIYNNSFLLECSVIENLPISNGVTFKYKLIRRLRLILKSIINSTIPAFAWFKIEQNYINPARKVISKYSNFSDVEYIIFQDFFTAYFYYKNVNIKHKKSILILHSSEELFSQFKIIYPSIFKSSYGKRLTSMAEYAINNVDKVVYVSKKAAGRNEFNKNGVKYVYNGLPDIKQSHTKGDIGILNFVCVGSINYNKGQDIIIEAVKLLPFELREKVKFYFIGDGPQSKELKNKVKRYKLTSCIEFLGIRTDVELILKKMDVFLLPSKTEGLPLSIIEALRQGLYIVATEVGGIPEMITEEFGQLVERDSWKLKNVIEDIVVNNKANQESRVASRLFYEKNFTLEMMINSYSDILKSLS